MMMQAKSLSTMGAPGIGSVARAGAGAGGVQVPVLAELVARGDGTYLLKPRVTEQDLDTWVTVAEAARILGMRPRTAYGLLGRYLVFRRPLPRKTVVSLKSALALRQATSDSEFWENIEQRRRLERQVTAQMQALAAAAEIAE